MVGFGADDGGCNVVAQPHIRVHRRVTSVVSSFFMLPSFSGYNGDNVVEWLDDLGSG